MIITLLNILYYMITGKQFKILIISTVHRRTSRDDKVGGNYGILCDPNLLNTAMTRAQDAVFVCGDAVTLLTMGVCKYKWRIYIEV